MVAQASPISKHFVSPLVRWNIRSNCFEEGARRQLYLFCSSSPFLLGAIVGRTPRTFNKPFEAAAVVAIAVVRKLEQQFSLTLFLCCRRN